MKVGIVTLPLHTNYGRILQASPVSDAVAFLGAAICYLCVMKNLKRTLG